MSRIGVAQERQWVMVLPEWFLKEAESSDCDPHFIKLRHPKTGEGTTFLVGADGMHGGKDKGRALLEMRALVEKEPRSWLIGQSVQEDGKLVLCTRVDPLFLTLPYLQRAHAKGKFEPLSQIVMDQEFPACSFLAECVGVRSKLHAVADEKGNADQKFYKYSQEKTLAWLETKVARVVKALKEKSIPVGAGVKSALFIRPDTSGASSEEEYLRYAHGLISEYLETELSSRLQEHLGIFDVSLVAEGEHQASKKRKRCDLRVEAAEDYSKGSHGAGKAAKPGKQTTAQRALAKVDRTGMKSISSFFTAKGENKS
ncbi:ribonuclease H2 subunit B isoform X2 [Petromyzon marinus]|uniref:Ribonuclease H2 subunit B n=1 Tax=Petromyzon marinus TaxID=7757 RepID=A0AAJ7U1K9_PETMA|nr:ribonuclease H2 subunit B [Petromyzon marinus]